MALPPFAIGVIAVSALTMLVLFFLSFDSLEYTEIGLCYRWISQTLDARSFNSGIYYLGFSNSFIKFPKMVQAIYFSDDILSTASGWGQTASFVGPSMQSRTEDGLVVHIEVSFQYRLKPDRLYDMYSHLGPGYEAILIRSAIEQIATTATEFEAGSFFTNRTAISLAMHREMQEHFKIHDFFEIPFFQLRTVSLPDDFEDAIRLTQVRNQEIQIAKFEQKAAEVTYETRVLQAERAVQVMTNEAQAEVAAIFAQNWAYCDQYNITQTLQMQGFNDIKWKSGWSTQQLLDFIRIRAVRDHSSEMTTIRL